MKKIIKYLAALAAFALLAACQKTPEKILKSIELDTKNAPVEFVVGQEFSYTGLVVNAIYSDKSTKQVTNFNVTAPDMSAPGEIDVLVSYTEGAVTASNTYKITIKQPKKLENIVLNTDTVKKSFVYGEPFTSEGLKVTAHYLDGTSGEVSGYTVTPPDMTVPGEAKDVLVSYTEGGITKTATYAISLNANLRDSVVFANNGYANAQAVAEAETVGKIAKIHFSKGSATNEPKYYTTGSAVRVYANGSFSVDSDKKIVGITVVFSSGDDGNAVTADCGAYADGVWTGESYYVTFTIGPTKSDGTTTGGHRRVAKIFVDYDASSPAPKSFKVEPEEVSIAADVTEASINVVTANDLSWTTSCDEAGVNITPASGTGNAAVKVTVPVNTGFAGKDYVIKFTTSDAQAKSKTVSATIKQDGKVLSKLSELNAIATKDGAEFIANLSGAIVTYVNGISAFIEDETAGTQIYANGHGLTAGEKISGKLTGTIKLYNGYGEITAMDKSKATITPGQTIPSTELTVAELKANPAKYCNMRIVLKGIEITAAIQNKVTGAIKQGENALDARGQAEGVDLVAGISGNLTAYSQMYNNAPQLSVYESSWFEVVGKQIALNAAKLADFKGLEATARTGITVENAYTLYNATDSDVNVKCDGIIVTGASVSNGAIQINVSKNETGASRECEVTLSINGGNSKSFTVSQKSAIAGAKTELDFATKASGNSGYSGEWAYGDWKIVNGANNNKGWAYVKMGGKSATIQNANPCYIYNTAAISHSVKKITVDIADGSLSKSGMSVNSWGVYVYSDKEMTTQIDYVAGGTITKNAGSFVFTPSEGKTWAKDYYYKVSWDLANTTSTNGIVCVAKITLEETD